MPGAPGEQTRPAAINHWLGKLLEAAYIFYHEQATARTPSFREKFKHAYTELFQEIPSPKERSQFSQHTMTSPCRCARKPTRFSSTLLVSSSHESKAIKHRIISTTLGGHGCVPAFE